MLSFYHLLIKKKYITRVSNSLDPDLARRYVEPDLGPKCLHRLAYQQTALAGKAFLLLFSRSDLDSEIPLFSGQSS